VDSKSEILMMQPYRQIEIGDTVDVSFGGSLKVCDVVSTDPLTVELDYGARRIISEGQVVAIKNAKVIASTTRGLKSFQQLLKARREERA
jgi:hypothetical protein